MEMEIVFISLVIALILVIYLIIKEKIDEKKQEKTQPSKKNERKLNQKFKAKYCKKGLMTPTELSYENAIKKALPENYCLLPQICLASIIKKTNDNYYVSELFRIIDFGIFDHNYNPVLLIEINDNTHKEKKRIARDYKVKELCEIAEIPLIRFWTEYGINQEYINKKISEYLD